MGYDKRVVNGLKRKWGKGIAAMLCLCLSVTLIACGSDAGGEKDAAMGRYVEALLDTPGGDEGIKDWAILARLDRSIDFYGHNEETGGYVKYNSKDGESWTREDLKWSFKEQNEYPVRFAADANEQLYVLTNYMDGENISSALYRQGVDGSLARQEMKWKPGSNMPSIMIQDMGLLENGDFIFYQVGLGLARFDGNGNYIGTVGSDRLENFVVLGNEIFAIDQEAGGVTVFDGASGNELRTIAFDNLSESTNIGAGAEGAVYLYNSGGVFRLAKGGELWEKIVDGSLTSLSVPSLYFSHFSEGLNQDFYFLCGDGYEKNQLARYRFDPSVAALPEKEVTVYTLYENKTVRQAVAQFQRSFPDTRVNVQVAMGEGGATEADLIRSLNTELLQGKGPDILVLDGLPIESYIEKGVLADLTDTIRQANKNGKLIDKVMDAYRTGDGVFAAPTKFSVPVLFTDQESAKTMTDLKSLSEFAAAHPEKGLFGDRTPERLMQIFLPACAPAWLTDSGIEETGLKEFLEQIQKIAQVPAPQYPLPPDKLEMNESVLQNGSFRPSRSRTNRSADIADVYHWSFGRAYAAVNTMDGMNDLMTPAQVMEKQGGTMILLPGQSKNVFFPSGVIGFNAKSDMLASASDFLEIMLSDSVQEVELFNGFPVSVKGFEKLSHTENDEVFFGSTNPYDENESISGGMPTNEQGKALMDLCLTVETPAQADPEIIGEIIQLAAGYFTGEKDVEQTVKDIVEGTKLYLSE